MGIALDDIGGSEKLKLVRELGKIRKFLPTSNGAGKLTLVKRIREIRSKLSISVKPDVATVKMDIFDHLMDFEAESKIDEQEDIKESEMEQNIIYDAAGGVYLDLDKEALSATVDLLKYFRDFIKSDAKLAKVPGGLGSIPHGTSNMDKESAKRILRELIDVAINRKAGIPDFTAEHDRRLSDFRHDARVINDYLTRRMRSSGARNLLRTPEMKKKYPHIDNQPNASFDSITDTMLVFDAVSGAEKLRFVRELGSLRLSMESAKSGMEKLGLVKRIKEIRDLLGVSNESESEGSDDEALPPKSIYRIHAKSEANKLLNGKVAVKLRRSDGTFETHIKISERAAKSAATKAMKTGNYNGYSFITNIATIFDGEDFLKDLGYTIIDTNPDYVVKQENLLEVGGVYDVIAENGHENLGFTLASVESAEDRDGKVHTYYDFRSANTAFRSSYESIMKGIQDGRIRKITELPEDEQQSQVDFVDSELKRIKGEMDDLVNNQVDYSLAGDLQAFSQLFISITNELKELDKLVTETAYKGKSAQLNVKYKDKISDLESYSSVKNHAYDLIDTLRKNMETARSKYIKSQANSTQLTKDSSYEDVIKYHLAKQGVAATDKQLSVFAEGMNGSSIEAINKLAGLVANSHNKASRNAFKFITGIMPAKKSAEVLAQLRQFIGSSVDGGDEPSNNSTMADVNKVMPILKQFIGSSQLSAFASGIRGEEGQFIKDKLIEVAGVIQSMPQTYGQDGMGDKAIAYLHYFKGSADWYITEKDMEGEQLQAFGLADPFGDGGELGYICIQELIGINVELDFYWTPKNIGEIKEKNQQSQFDRVEGKTVQDRLDGAVNNDDSH